MRVNAEDEVALYPLKSPSLEDFTSIVFMVPLLLLFTIQVEAIHIRNLTFRRAWEWMQRLWASKLAESCPLLLKFTMYMALHTLREHTSTRSIFSHSVVLCPNCAPGIL